MDSVGAHLLRAPAPDSGRLVPWYSFPDATQDYLRFTNDLERSSLVRWAATDRITPTSSDFIPTDTYFDEQYYLRNRVYQKNGVWVDINVEQAWDLPEPGHRIKVAVIDQGVQRDHPEFASVLHGYDARYDRIDPAGCTQDCASMPIDPYSYHGTWVAGVIAASHDGVGVAGIAPFVDILPIRIQWRTSYTNFATASALEKATAINYAWKQESADILSNSWSLASPNLAVDEPVAEAFDSATVYGRGGLGAPVVFSTGNYSDRAAGVVKAANPYAVLPRVLGVAAIDQQGNPANYAGSDSEIDISAVSSATDTGGTNCPNPSNGVYSTDLQSDGACDLYQDVGYTKLFGGTSAAVPQVSAALALLLGREPSLTLSQAYLRIENYADDWGTQNDHGAGKLNVYRSLVPPTPPTVQISGPTMVAPSQTCSWDAAISGGSPPFQYTWRKDGVWVGNQSTYAESVGSSGQFDLQVSIVDSYSQGDSHQVSITIDSRGEACFGL